MYSSACSDVTTRTWPTTFGVSVLLCAHGSLSMSYNGAEALGLGLQARDGGIVNGGLVEGSATNELLEKCAAPDAPRRRSASPRRPLRDGVAA